MPEFDQRPGGRDFHRRREPGAGARSFMDRCARLVFLMAVCCGTAQAMNIATAIQTTVRVQAERADGSLSVGSGVVLPGERVVTACHVVAGAQTLKASYQYVAKPATVVRRDDWRDLCVLSVPGLAAPAAKLARAADLRSGDRLLAFNGAYGVDVRLLVGALERTHDMDGAPVMQVSVPFAIGDSGGGLFNVAGELVGILAFVAKTAGEERYAIPIEWLDADIDAARTVPFWRAGPADMPAFLRAR